MNDNLNQTLINRFCEEALSEIPREDLREKGYNVESQKSLLEPAMMLELRYDAGAASTGFLEGLLPRRLKASDCC